MSDLSPLCACNADMILILPNNPVGFSSAGTGNHTQLKNCGLTLRQAGIKSFAQSPARLPISRDSIAGTACRIDRCC
jgi:hypothetical protein